MEIKDWPLSTKTVNLLLNSGFQCIEDIQDKKIEDFLEIAGFGAKSLKELREWCKIKYKIVFKHRQKEKKKALKNYKAARQVVDHLIKGPKNWANQLKIADKLLEKYDLELLLRVKPQEKIWSLAWYNTDYGAKYIRQFMEGRVELDEVIRVEIELGEADDFTVGAKPKTLKDFLKL